MKDENQVGSGEKPLLSVVDATGQSLGSSSPHRGSPLEREKYWGDIDQKKLVIDWSDHYIVFLDDKGELDWETSFEFDHQTYASKEGLANHNSILADAALLEAKPCEDLRAQDKEWFKYLIGKAMVFCFDRDYENAQKTLFKAEQYFRARSEELSRSWYLTASFWYTLPFLALGVTVWILRDWLQTQLGPTAFLLMLFLVAGATGALLSVIARSGNLNFDCSAGQKLHNLEAASRIVMGALSGAIVGFAVKSKLFLEPLSAAGAASNVLLMLAAFAGGSSERLLGSIISKFDPNIPSDNNPPEKKT